MRRQDFEHVIAAAAAVTGEEEIVVVGSQAVLGSHPDAPAEMVRSIEADLYPRHSPEKAIEIDAALGDGSPFHRTYGYYAHGVGPETAKAPEGWQGRLVRIDIPARPGSSKGATALCLEIHDLVLAKCAAGRDRDWEYARAAITGRLVEGAELLRRCEQLPLSTEHRARVRRWLEANLDAQPARRPPPPSLI